MNFSVCQVARSAKVRYHRQQSLIKQYQRRADLFTQYHCVYY